MIGYRDVARVGGWIYRDGRAKRCACRRFACAQVNLRGMRKYSCIGMGYGGAHEKANFRGRREIRASAAAWLLAATVGLMAKKNSEETAGRASPGGAEDTAKKQRGRPFRPGESGNPAGRPAGSRNKTTAICAELLGEDAEDIMAACIRRAKKGDGIALRLCVERLLPVRASRDRVVELDLPAVAKAGDLVTAAAAVIAEAAAGRVTLSEAREVMQLLEAERRVIETAELAVRVEVLEASLGEGGQAAGAREDRGASRRLDDAELGRELASRVRRLVVRIPEPEELLKP